MPRVKTTAPNPTRDKGQRSLDLPLYLDRVLPQWQQPDWQTGEIWRKVVASQEIATICRETLISNYLSFDWKIEPRDSEKRDELKEEIDYYSTFLEYTGDYDYTEIIEWIGRDFFDLPFGAAAEIGRLGDEPQGKVSWIELLDGVNLFPSLNRDFPVGQQIRELALQTVYFPAHAINRVYMSPRTEIRRKGWGMPPPEKIWFALNLISRGDIYYANLMLDTPSAGILDLGDMAEDSAKEWVLAWRNMLTGIDPFKIPVLYEHEKPATWIPFTRNPAELMFDKSISQYISIITSGYGMTTSDIGFSTATNGGDTLAGSIRQERHTKKTGFARYKKKMLYWFNRILPSYLKYSLIDQDDELMTNIGRARLANSTAFSSWIDKRMFSPQELRQQAIADGLITISVPESLPDESEFAMVQMNQPLGGGSERPSLLGKPINPSQGGYGEIRSMFDVAYENNTVFRSKYDELSDIFDSLTETEQSIRIEELQDMLHDFEQSFSNAENVV